MIAEQVETTSKEAEAAPRRLLTREEYHRAAELGIFGPDEHLELIHGEVYRKVSPQSRRHARAIRRTARCLERVFGDRFDVQQQLPIGGPGESEPEPDVAVIKGTADDYIEHPTGDAVALAVEVADTSLAGDRTVKARLYAEAGVPEYWLLDVKNGRLEVYREPDGSAREYRSRRIYSREETVAPLGVPHAAIAVRDLLPA